MCRQLTKKCQDKVNHVTALVWSWMVKVYNVELNNNIYPIVYHGDENSPDSGVNPPAMQLIRRNRSVGLHEGGGCLFRLVADLLKCVPARLRHKFIKLYRNYEEYYINNVFNFYNVNHIYYISNVNINIVNISIVDISNVDISNVYIGNVNISNVINANIPALMAPDEHPEEPTKNEENKEITKDWRNGEGTSHSLDFAHEEYNQFEEEDDFKNEKAECNLVLNFPTLVGVVKEYVEEEEEYRESEKEGIKEYKEDDYVEPFQSGTIRPDFECFGMTDPDFPNAGVHDLQQDMAGYGEEQDGHEFYARMEELD